MVGKTLKKLDFPGFFRGDTKTTFCQNASKFGVILHKNGVFVGSKSQLVWGPKLTKNTGKNLNTFSQKPCHF